MFDGHVSAVLAYNASVATMKTAIEGMWCFRNLPRRVTATCSATAAAGTSFTVTLSGVDDPDAVFRRSGEVLQMLTGKPLRDEAGNEVDSRSPVSGGSPAGSFRRQAPAADGGGQAAILAPVVRTLEAGARERAALGQSVKQLQQQLEELKSMVAI